MIALDTFALLKSIAGAPETFAPVEDDLEKVAIASVKKLLRAKGLTLDGLRALSRAIGPDDLGFILGHESTKDKEITDLVRKLDQYWPMRTTARVNELRDHLLALAAGAAEPSAKREKAQGSSSKKGGAKSAKKGAAEPKGPEWSSAMGARAQKVA
jgi:hypothetical protein